MENIIEVKNIAFGYGDKNILEDFNLNIQDRKFTCIVGENGSGKSTLIKLITGINKVQKGSKKVEVNVGYLPQRTLIQINFPASVEEVVLSGTINNNVKRIRYTKENKERALQSMKDLGIIELKKSCFSELSGGQQQRVLIARALCATDRLLILDEPVNGLDPSIVTQIYELLVKIKNTRNIAILMVSHDIARAINYCEHVIEMKDGKVVFEGPTSKFVEKENIGWV